MKMRPGLVFLFAAGLALSSVPSSGACLYLSEVSPQEPEWVEVGSACPFPVNVSGWSISDNYASDSVTCYDIPGCSAVTDAPLFLVIGRKNNVTEVTGAPVPYFYVDDSAIGNGLGNDGDLINLSNSSWSASMGYDRSAPGRTWCLCGGAWKDCPPTPGRPNSCNASGSGNAVALVLNAGPFVTGTGYHGLFGAAVPGSDNCPSGDRVSLDYFICANGSDVLRGNASGTVGCNGTLAAGAWTPSQPGNYWMCCNITFASAAGNDPGDDLMCVNATVLNMTVPVCDLSAAVEAAGALVESGEALRYDVLVEDLLRSGREYRANASYWVLDAFGRALPGYPKSASVLLNGSGRTGMRQFTAPDIAGSGIYFIRACASSDGCADADPSNDCAESMFAVKGADPGCWDRSYVRIASVEAGTGGKGKFGGSVLVGVEICRNSTDKYAVYVWAEDASGAIVSAKTKMHARARNALYEYYVPVLLEPDCAGERGDGTYRIVASGLDSRDEMEFAVEGSEAGTCVRIPCKDPQGGKAAAPAMAAPARKGGILLVSAPNGSVPGGPVEVAAVVMNPSAAPGNYSAYSYVFNGTRCVSLGFDGKTWANTWDANRQDFVVPAGFSQYVRLRNLIENGTAPGRYRLKVRLRSGNATEDLVMNLTVLEPAARRPEKPPENGTRPAAGAVPDAPTPRITGSAVAGKAPANGGAPPVLGLLIGMFSWVKSFFKF